MPIQRSRSGIAALCAAALLLGACTSDGDKESTSTTPAITSPSSSDATDCPDTTESSQDPQVDEILALVGESMTEQDLKAVTLSIRRGGSEVLTTGLGETVERVPATPDMHFWNGAIVFTYLGTIMLQLAEEGVLDIDEPVARFLPDIPEADSVTPRMLMSSMSGYTDYVAEDQFITDLYADPFRAFTQDELEAYVFDKPLRFDPGTNVGYSHLNFRLAGEVIEGATGQPLADVLSERIIEPLGLTATSVVSDAIVPAPRLFTFTDERDNYEDSSLWSAAWGVPHGATMVTTVCDVVAAGAVIGSGELLSDESYETLVNPGTAAVGRRDDDCPTCIPMSDELHLGMGVTVAGDWVIQTPLFTGIAGLQAYLPAEDLSIAIVNTYGENSDVGINGSTEIFRALVPLLAPDSALPQF
jgi:CubicO group peptidase (beta-lactamase class C family)